ncbi:MAG TPA: GNAT family N-acetyltransferase [Casimicrobiaceae bacterium]
MTIRALGAGDFAAYRQVRLRALAEHPEAFTSSVEEEDSAAGDARLARRLAGSADRMLGAFEADALVGTIGLSVDPRAKVRHRGLVVGMYVVPEQCGRGVGRALVEAQIAQARTAGLSGLHLTVTAGNDAARRLYERAGFAVVGRDPDAMRITGVSYDKLIMYRPL